MNWLAYLSPLIGIILIIAGVPGFALFYNATQDWNISLLLFIVYELVIIVGGISIKVWQKLEGKWVERMAGQADQLLQSFFSRYEKKYLEYVIYQHRVFDVKGLTTQGPYNLDLEKIYVQLSVDPTALPVKKDSINPLSSLPENLRLGSHSIWSYIKRDTHTKNLHYVILGTPGSGKTTLVKYIALTFAVTKRPSRKSNPIPILLFLREHISDIINNPNAPLAKLIQEQFRRREAPIQPEGWLESKLENGQCIVMLDGLDEVADPEQRKTMVAWVEQKMKVHGKNRFIITARPHGYQPNPIEGVTVLQVRPFTFSQVEKFAHNWYLANEIMSSQKDDPGVYEIARAGANDLLKRIRSNSALSDMTVNPLLLTMIATVHRYRSSLPGRRIELYAEIAEVFLGKRQMSRGLHLNLTPNQKIRVLSQLAYAMMVHEIREVDKATAIEIINEPLSLVSPKLTPMRFLKEIEDLSGLLIEKTIGKYSFSHLTFQEHLASVYILENQKIDVIVEKVNSSWWHETIRLYCAQTDASLIIIACLDNLSPQTLSLALECEKEAREISPAIRANLRAMLDNGLESSDPDIQKLAANALLFSRTN